jgi:hypothetical protein
MAWRSFYGQGVQDFGILFLLFFFLPSVAPLESILFGLLKVSQAHLELAAWQPGGPAGGQRQCGGGVWPVLSVYGGMEKPSTA